MLLRYYMKGQLERSTKFAARSMKVYPDDPLANYQYGLSMNAYNRFSESIPYLEKANYYVRRKADWIAELGTSYFNTQQGEKAAEAFKAAINLKPRRYYKPWGGIFCYEFI